MAVSSGAADGRAGDGVAAAGSTGMAAVPPVVQVLAGNSVTGVMVFSCLTAADTRALRQLHPAVAGIVATVAWSDMETEVKDVVRWRAALPAAVGARLVRLPKRSTAVAVWVGITDLDLSDCDLTVTKKTLACLPRSLRTLNVSNCGKLSGAVSFTHLPELTSLDCSGTAVDFEDMSRLPPSLRELQMDSCDMARTADFQHLNALQVLSIRGSKPSSSTLASLPPSLQDLDMSDVDCWPTAAPLAHLLQLKVFSATRSAIVDDMLASLPSCLTQLTVSGCRDLTPAASFAHLHALQVLNVSVCAIGDASFASLPPSLVSLDAPECRRLTSAATLPHLPLLRVLHVNGTDIGDAAVASLPAALEELDLSECGHVTPVATLDHLPALRVLHSCGTNLSRAVGAACRARGCYAPTAGMLRGHGHNVLALALLPDGRLASGDESGEVRLWDLGREDEAAAVVFQIGDGELCKLAALPGGRGLAIVTLMSDPSPIDCVEVWDVECVPPVRRTTIDCGDSSVSVVTALHDGRLAAGCDSGRLLIIDVDAGAVTATLETEDQVAAFAVLPDGRLACGCSGFMVQVWDVDARKCVAVMAAPSAACSLAVLSDGRLACGLAKGAVQLWDTGTRTCVGTIACGKANVSALVALPDGRLASATGYYGYDTVWLCDTTYPSATVADTVPPWSLLACLPATIVTTSEPALALLPDGRLASPQRGGYIQLLAVPPAAPA